MEIDSGMLSLIIKPLVWIRDGYSGLHDARKERIEGLKDEVASLSRKLSECKALANEQKMEIKGLEEKIRRSEEIRDDLQRKLDRREAAVERFRHFPGIR